MSHYKLLLFTFIFIAVINLLTCDEIVAETKTEDISFSNSGVHESYKDRLLNYITPIIDTSLEYSKNYIIRFHKNLTEQLGIQYPFDLIIFMLVGYSLSYMLGLCWSKKVII